MRTILISAIVITACLLPASATAQWPPAPTPAPGLSDRVDSAVGQWPLRPRPEVANGFDPPATPWGAGHRGADLVGRPGQLVHAALDGEVTYAATLAGRGVVTVSHGDTRTTYEPVRASVAVGDHVTTGEVLGTLQYAGSHCLPRTCLHWGWKRGDTYLDPLELVGVWPIRLLPLAGLAG